MIRLILALLAAGLVSGARADCTFSLSANPASIPATGGTGAVTVTASSPDCVWSFGTTVTWISAFDSKSGPGSGSVGFVVGSNPGTQSRSGAVTVNGQSASITQDGNVCDFSISQTSTSIPGIAQTGSFSFTVPATCSWTASSSAPWLQITGGSTGYGGSTVSYSAQANNGRAARTGRITVGGPSGGRSVSFTVSQSGTCAFSLDSFGAAVSAAGEGGSFSVATDTGCSWTAVSGASWITVSSGATGSGSGTVGYTVAANTGVPRMGTITAGGQTFRITQAGVACTLSLSPTAATLTAGGGSGTITVTAPAVCSWTAGGSAVWISTSSSGTGNGVVSYSVAASSSPGSRNGAIQIGDQSFPVLQSGQSCKYTVSPNSREFPNSGGSSTVSVTATSGCAWSASSSAPWVTIPPAPAGSGNGSVAFSVAGNPTAQPRTALLSVGDQVVSVSQQAGACPVTLDTASANINSGGGTGRFNVTADCPFSAVSQAAWITVTASANGTVAFAVAANPLASTRTGQITVGNQTFSVQQAATPCLTTLSPNGAEISPAGGVGTVQVTAAGGCSWAPQADSGWIHLRWSAINGIGSVTYAIDPTDSLLTRTGSVTIAGQSFTLTQQPTAIPLAAESIGNGASGLSGAVSPGLALIISAGGIHADQRVASELSADRRSITSRLAETRVLFDGDPGPMVFVAEGALSAIVPYSVDGKGSVRVQIESRGQLSNVVTLPVAAAAPAIFTQDLSGTGQGAITNQDQSQNSASNPAAAGSVISFLATGEGQTIPAGVDGRLAVAPLPKPALPVAVTIDAMDAELVSAGAAAGQVSGLMLVSVRVPAGVRSGGAPIVLRVGAFESQTGVTVALR